MEKIISLKDRKKQTCSLKSNYLGYFNNPAQLLRSLTIDLLDAFITFEPSEKQIVDLENHLKKYFANHQY